MSTASSLVFDSAYRQPASAPSSPQETRLDLDLSEEGHPFFETLIVPASEAVSLFNGLPEPASSLRVGDYLWMSGHHLGQVKAVRTEAAPSKSDASRVYGTTRRLVDRVVDLTTSDETLTTTAEHPFMVAGRGWVAAGALRAGDRLQTASGRLVSVVRVEVRSEPRWVYNLKVAGTHTYFVGKDQLLVHNSGDCVPEVERTIGIAEQDGEAVHIVGNGPNGSIEVMANLRREGESLILDKAHIDGPGAGKIGVGELGEFARQFGRQEGVKEIIVRGAQRTTGARIGHIPRPFIFRVD